jgi:hypothetical protein
MFSLVASFIYPSRKLSSFPLTHCLDVLHDEKVETVSVKNGQSPSMEVKYG